MKRSLHFICPFLLFLYTACQNQPDGDDNDSYSFQFVLVDAIVVDHMERLSLEDYDPNTQEFLASNSRDHEIVIFDHEGTIRHQFNVPLEGPEGVKFGITSKVKFHEDHLNFFNDHIYSFSKEGEFMQRIPFPYPPFRHIQNSTDAIFLLDGKMAYPKPGIEDEDNTMPVYYKKIVDGGPVLEVLDTTDQTFSHTMHFPKNNSYQEGVFYGYPFTNIHRHEDQWFLSLPNKMEFHVYREEGSEVNFEQTVVVPTKDPFLNKPVPLDEYERYFETNHNMFTMPSVHTIFPMDETIVAFYYTGINPEKILAIDVQDPTERQRLIATTPKKYAVFDQHFQPLQTELDLPDFIVSYGMLQIGGSKIVALKDQEAVGIEEDFQTYYIFELTKTVND